MKKDFANLIYNFMKHLKTWNTHKIFEAQVFDIDSQKKPLISLIDKIKKGETPHKGDKNLIYGIIRNTTLGVSTAVDPKLIASWKDYFSEKNGFVTGGSPWAQRSFGENFPRKTGNKTLNYYITLEQTLENVKKFWKGITALDKSLSKFSSDNSTPITYKTHRHIQHLLQDNDSLKVYYYDLRYKDSIQSLVKQWANDNGIKIESRSHEHGVDIKRDNDYDPGSYGEILADAIMKTLVDSIKKNPNYSSEKWFEWLKLHFANIIKSAKIDYSKI